MFIRKEKIQFFEERLLDFFRKAGREHLPWRVPSGGTLRGKKSVSAYEVWVSEVMLQQTQVNRVVEYYNRFLKKFPTVEKLAKASWEEFLPYYQGLGYYARGRNMLKAAKVVVKEYDGVFPREKQALEKLPGVGPYTAAAILSFAYDDNHIAWDTNLKRVFGRFFFGSKAAPLDTLYWENKFLASKKELNGALMDFGSSICVARPKCEACMLRKRCTYYREGGKQEEGQKQEKKSFPLAEAQVYLWLHERHQKYFSSQKNKLAPFVLPASRSTRASIKEYFRKRFGLELAVRPPYKRGYLGKVPTFFVNAQILLGEPRFSFFGREASQKVIRAAEDTLT